MGLREGVLLMNVFFFIGCVFRGLREEKFGLVK